MLILLAESLSFSVVSGLVLYCHTSACLCYCSHYNSLTVWMNTSTESWQLPDDVCLVLSTTYRLLLHLGYLCYLMARSLAECFMFTLCVYWQADYIHSCHMITDEVEPGFTRLQLSSHWTILYIGTGLCCCIIRF